MTIVNGPGRKKTCLRRFVNNNGADQPAHPRSLISPFVIHLLERVKYHIYSCYERNFNFLASLCSWAGWFESHFVGNPEDRFSRSGAHMDLGTRKPDFVASKSLRQRPACASAQSDQCLCYSLSGKYSCQICSMQKFNFLASLSC